jgi:L-ribulokinase
VLDRSATDAVVIGIDFGTLAGRAVVVRTVDGEVLAGVTLPYRHGVLERQLPDGRTPLPPEWALQVPGDYLEVLQIAVPQALHESGVDPAAVVGIGIDFTACTVLPTLADGTPLCELPELSSRPHAYVKLWKHHAAQPQANRITAVARDRDEGWLSRYGGAVSSESEFPKGLQIFDEDPELYTTMSELVEAGDWIVWRLCGSYVRSAAYAGYKGMHQDGHYPSRGFFEAVRPGFADFAGDKLGQHILPAGARAGALTVEAASWTGLPEGMAVAVAGIDAHVTPPAARAVEAGQMTLIMGTSTCHLVSSDTLCEVPGMSGAVMGGIVPGLWGYEAGQSGVGDIFGWFVEHGVPPAYHQAAADRGVGLHEHLSELAARQPIGAHGLLALDWHGGNRSVLGDHELSGVVIGQTLATRPEDIYRALLEATAFGTRIIIDAYESSGISIGDLVVAGGLLKNPLLMQIYADVTDRRLSTLASDEGSALGSAIQAAVAAGTHPDLRAAAEAMGRIEQNEYRPIPANVRAYAALFEDYRRLHDYFGRGGNDVMHRLKKLRREALATAGETEAP